MTQNERRPTRKTTETSLTVLEAINDLEDATLSKLSDHTGLATSTVHTHLETLERTEYVIQTGTTYHLGFKVFHLGENARYRDDRYRLAKQTVSELADRTSEEVNFSVEEYGRSIVLFEASSPRREEFQVGRYFHMHSSASGKAMLANYPDDRVREIIEKCGLPEHTSYTITDTDELFDELSTVQDQGYAVNRQEEIEGMRAVAMAVNEPDGSVFGTLDISGPSYRLPDDSEIAEQVRPFVRELEEKLAQYE
jgi:IclR family acetate operon transcriptional repressor